MGVSTRKQSSHCIWGHFPITFTTDFYKNWVRGLNVLSEARSCNIAEFFFFELLLIIPFKKTQHYLTDLGIEFFINSRIRRPLDYLGSFYQVNKIIRNRNCIYWMILESKLYIIGGGRNLPLALLSPIQKTPYNSQCHSPSYLTVYIRLSSSC